MNGTVSYIHPTPTSDVYGTVTPVTALSMVFITETMPHGGQSSHSGYVVISRVAYTLLNG